MLPSCPCWSQADVAIAILCGEIIFPPVAPAVFAADNHVGSTPVCAATPACNLPNRMFADVSLPVKKVPNAPIMGANNG